MEAQEVFRRRRETFGKLSIHTSAEKLFAQGVYIHVWVCIECGTEFGSYAMWEKQLREQQQTTPKEITSLASFTHADEGKEER